MTDGGTGERRWERVWDSLAVMAGMIAIALVASRLVRLVGDQYPLYAARVPVPWVPLGLAVGVLYFRGPNRWPGVLAGAIGTGLAVGGIPPAAAVLQGLSATLFALTIRALLRAWRVNPALERWQDPLLLWLSAAIGASAMGLVAGTVVLAVAGLQLDRAGHGMARVLIGNDGRPIFHWPLFAFVASWMANWTSGAALVIPAMRLLNGTAWHELRHRSRELCLIALILLGWATAAFLPLPWIASVPLFLVALTTVTWSAMRFRAAVASLIPLVFALIESAAFIAGRGPLLARSADAIWVLWTFVLVISLFGMLITSLMAERDAAYRRQAASEMRYRALFESSPRPLWVYDQATLRILMVNEAAMRLYGYSFAEFTGMPVSVLDGADEPSTTAPHGQGRKLDEGERRHRTRSGTVVEVELHAVPIELDGRAARLVFSDDVTDRNRLRGALLEAADRVERQLGRELHDGLGQDLVALSLIARAESDRIQKGGAPEPKALALIESVALRAVENCRGIARGLSALAETGGDLYGAFRRLPDRFRHRGPPVIVVTIEGSAPLALPEGAQDHIYRIVQEAITNAVKHADSERIDVVLKTAPDAIRLTVQDDGRGLPADFARRGGLGLASMHHRASAIGAQLYVTNSLGGGTEVRLEYGI
jgi:PAS domain S-box-containing protein